MSSPINLALLEVTKDVLLAKLAEIQLDQPVHLDLEQKGRTLLACGYTKVSSNPAYATFKKVMRGKEVTVYVGWERVVVHWQGDPEPDIGDICDIPKQEVVE